MKKIELAKSNWLFLTHYRFSLRQWFEKNYLPKFLGMYHSGQDEQLGMKSLNAILRKKRFKST
jgi:hypothetical protein